MKCARTSTERSKGGSLGARERRTELWRPWRARASQATTNTGIVALHWHAAKPERILLQGKGRYHFLSTDYGATLKALNSPKDTQGFAQVGGAGAAPGRAGGRAGGRCGGDGLEPQGIRLCAPVCLRRRAGVPGR